MKIFILFISFFLSAILFVQAQPTIDFETGGNGAAYTWTVFENDTPPMEIVTNPNASGGNTSSMVAKMRVLQTNANYAGVVTRSFTPFTLSASNSIVKIMVYKSVISDVGIKFEANFASTGEIKVANTKINEWEELTFDFSGKIGEASSTNIDGIVIFPDFNTRTAETITHFDNLTFSASSTGGGGATALPVDFEDAGGPYTFNDFEGGAASVIDNPGSAGINTSAKVAQMKKFAGATYGGTTLALDGTVDFSAGSIVKMKVWASRAVPVTLKLEGLNVERVVSHTGSGTWEELSFDFTGSTGAGVAAITLIFDNGIAGDAAGNSANWTFYFDDIKLAAALPPNTSVSTIDFETPGNGAAYTWNVFENDTPPLEIVANPNANGINTSATVAKMRVLQTNANYAGTVTRSFTPFTLDASNSIVKIMVYKNVISDVGIKFEANFASTGEIKVANTKINEWEELTFDFTGKIGQPSSTKIDGLVIFPDFNTRTGETISYFDNIRFTSQSTGGGDPTSPALPLDFQSSTIDYTFSDFEGGAVTVIDNPQSNGINTSSKVGKMVKNPGAVYAGSLIALASPIDFSTNKTFKVKVFMPKVGAKLLLKVENLTDNTKNYEKEATGTVANAWEELTFDYSAINTANQYQKIILIFDLGTAGDGGANFTYLFDDIRLTTDGGTTPTLPVLPLDFQSATTDYTFSDFEGGVVTVIDNPQSNTINTSTKVGKMVKNAGAVYAGSLITLASPMDFSSNKIFKVKVFMPKVGAKLLLKVENLTDASKNYEKEVTGTVANAWEELTFDYSAINTANQYQKIILIFDNGTVGDGSANFTYLFDDLRLTTSGGNVSTSPVLPLDFESTTITYAFTDFNGGGTTVISNPQISGINTSATVGKMIKSAGQVWGGSWTSLASPIDFSVNKAFKVKVFMPRVGAKLLLKVENQTNGAIAFEKEATGTVANAWEELTFDYSTINTANQYQKLVLIFDLGTNGDGTANFTYLFDDIRLVASNGGEVTLTQMNLPVTFDVATVEYGLAGFGGADASTVVTDPTLSTNKVAKVVKSAGAETWAGTTITAVSGNVQTGFSSKIPFTTSEKKMNVRVWSPDAGVKVLMKVEDYLDPSKSVETSATTTVAGNWETLNFDFGIQSEGTAALNLAYNYNKASIFFNFGVTGAVAGEKTYYFDDVKFGEAVILQSQTITFPAITDKTAGGASFALTATASSGLAVTYSTTSDKITISGSQVTIVKAGRASVTASQDGNASFNPAVSVENSFCIKPAKPVITINGGNTEAVTLTSSATAGNQWYLNGTAITNATNATVAATSQGLYKVKVTVDDCVSEFSDETALIVTGDIQTLFKQVSAYPNPAENYLEVRGIEGELSNAQLFDLTGRANMIVFERNGDVHQANVQHVTKGVYLLKLTAGNKIHQIKIIKN